jgi:HemX protein
MPLSQQLLLAATLTFVGAVVQALLALKSGAWKQGRAQLMLMAGGFALQTAFIYLRGQEVGQCPMKSLPDILVFIAWSIVLLYFLVGSAFRLSLLGVFTAPLISIMQIMALVGGFAPYAPKGKINALVELHAAVALIAYAAFALACITGVMYLIQERMLKKHQIGGLFYQLPPIQGLSNAIQRLVRLGLLLLSIALGISFALQTSVSNPKLVFSWVVWAFVCCHQHSDVAALHFAAQNRLAGRHRLHTALHLALDRDACLSRLTTASASSVWA